MNVAFVLPHWTSVFGGFSLIAGRVSAFPPLNLAMLAALAESRGHTALVIDAEIERLTVEETIERLRDFRPDLVGFTATTPLSQTTSEWALRIKQELGVRTAIGGFHVTLFGEQAFPPHFDFGFLGEADRSFPEFLACEGDDSLYPRIPGLLYRRRGEVVSTGMAEPTRDLDALPLPARHLLKTTLYRVGSLRGEHNYTTIMASRGCPFACIFCSNRISGTTVRRRSVARVVAEITSAVESFGVGHFSFVDDVLTLDRAFIMSFARAVLASGLTITFEGSTRADLVDDELLGLLKQAGLIRLSFGLETTDPEIRSIIKKGVPLESYAVANRIANRHGIETINSVMLGLPGDTRETMAATIRYLRNSRDLKHATLSIAIPYPGTELYEMARRGEHGLKLLSNDFSRYQRYGSAVMAVNGISPEELLRLQKIGLLKIYAVPWRLLSSLRRVGFRALLVPGIMAVLAYLRQSAARWGGALLNRPRHQRPRSVRRGRIH